MVLKNIDREQEKIKVRERIPHIGPLTKVIPLKLFLDIVPSSSERLLACCVDVFVEDLFVFRFVSFRSVSKQRKTSNAGGMSS